jgi:hypothetical protein
MVRPFEDYVEGQLAEVEFTLNVKCTEGRSLDVTDLDLVPDASHSVVPVTQALMKQQGGSVKPGAVVNDQVGYSSCHITQRE